MCKNNKPLRDYLVNKKYLINMRLFNSKLIEAVLNHSSNNS